MECQQKTSISLISALQRVSLSHSVHWKGHWCAQHPCYVASVQSFISCPCFVLHHFLHGLPPSFSEESHAPTLASSPTPQNNHIWSLERPPGLPKEPLPDMNLAYLHVFVHMVFGGGATDGARKEFQHKPFFIDTIANVNRRNLREEEEEAGGGVSTASSGTSQPPSRHQQASLTS